MKDSSLRRIFHLSFIYTLLFVYYMFAIPLLSVSYPFLVFSSGNHFFEIRVLIQSLLLAGQNSHSYWMANVSVSATELLLVQNSCLLINQKCFIKLIDSLIMLNVVVSKDPNGKQLPSCKKLGQNIQKNQHYEKLVLID